MALNISVQRS